MATYDLVSASPRITTPPAVAVRVLAAFAGLWRAWKNRRAFYRLGEMTDAELADIGLARADLRVVEVSFGADPTQQLGAIAAERARRNVGAVRKTR